MANETKSTQKSAKAQEPSIAFKDMDGSQKLVFIGKVCLFLITCGFAFPTIFAD